MLLNFETALNIIPIADNKYVFNQSGISSQLFLHPPHLKSLLPLYSTDSIQPSEAVVACEKIRAMTTAELLGEAIRRVSNEESVSTLFNM